MITAVYWEEVEADFDDDGELADIDSESALLTIIEDPNEAINRIIKHKKENEGREIRYACMFWLDGEPFTHAVIKPDADVEEYREEIVNFAKNLLH